MNKYAVFTAIIGNYDRVHQPEVVDNRFDYYLFSNDIRETQIGVWKVRTINYMNDIPTKIARWVKTHPEELLPDYECSLWIDAREIIKSRYVYDRVIALFNSNELISTHINPELVCIYQEMLSMILLQWEKESTTINWGVFLRKEGYPRWIGTNETGVLYRKHKDKKIELFDQMWWWCIANYSRRDQFSFHFVLWKLGLQSIPFLPEGCDVRHSEYIELLEHTNDRNKIIVDPNSSQLIRYYRKHVNERSTIENVYFWLYGRNKPFFWLSVIGTVFRLKHLLLFYLGRKNNTDYESEVKRIINTSPHVIEERTIPPNNVIQE